MERFILITFYFKENHKKDRFMNFIEKNECIKEFDLKYTELENTILQLEKENKPYSVYFIKKCDKVNHLLCVDPNTETEEILNFINSNK